MQVVAAAAVGSRARVGQAEPQAGRCAGWVVPGNQARGLAVRCLEGRGLVSRRSLFLGRQ